MNLGDYWLDEAPFTSGCVADNVIYVRNIITIITVIATALYHTSVTALYWRRHNGCIRRVKQAAGSEPLTREEALVFECVGYVGNVQTPKP